MIASHSSELLPGHPYAKQNNLREKMKNIFKNMRKIFENQ